MEEVNSKELYLAKSSGENSSVEKNAATPATVRELEFWQHFDAKRGEAIRER
jgi:hypothetical protein